MTRDACLISKESVSNMIISELLVCDNAIWKRLFYRDDTLRSRKILYVLSPLPEVAVKRHTGHRDKTYRWNKKQSWLVALFLRENALQFSRGRSCSAKVHFLFLIRVGFRLPTGPACAVPQFKIWMGTGDAYLVGGESWNVYRLLSL